MVSCKATKTWKRNDAFFRPRTGTIGRVTRLQLSLVLGKFCGKLLIAQNHCGHICSIFISASYQTVKRNMSLELQRNILLIIYFQSFRKANLRFMSNLPQNVQCHTSQNAARNQSGSFSVFGSSGNWNCCKHSYLLCYFAKTSKELVINCKIGVPMSSSCRLPVLNYSDDLHLPRLSGFPSQIFSQIKAIFRPISTARPMINVWLDRL
jgi:hypothetical protein